MQAAQASQRARLAVFVQSAGACSPFARAGDGTSRVARGCKNDQDLADEMRRGDKSIGLLRYEMWR